jgi:hypothetical protein
MKNRILSLIAALVLTSGTFAVSVTTDRTWYLAGEAMTISVTADDALIAYAELCDTRGLAAGVVVGLNGGVGEKVMELPADLHSGYYVLSVYTRGDASVSRRLVAVVNPLRASADDDIEWVEGPSCLPQPGEGDTLIASPGRGRLLGAEREGHILRARVRTVYNGHTYGIGEITPSLSVVGKQIHYFEGNMVDDSTAVFFTYGVHGKHPIVLSALTSADESLPIELISPFVTLLPEQLPHLVFHYRRSEVEARSLDMQRHQRAITPAKREVKLGDRADETAEDGVPLDYDATLFGTRPDLSYNLDEYRQFLTVREVLIEYVQCVTRMKTNGVTRLYVRREQDQYNNALPTLVLIDGMPVLDVERLLSYDARRIHYINIYGDQYTFGKGVYNGILSFVTRSGRLTNYPTEPNAQYLVYEFP